MLIIFTGNGKGKTTAALGQAMRAIGNGSRVLMVQFIKGPWESGEHRSAMKLAPELKIESKVQIIDVHSAEDIGRFKEAIKTKKNCRKQVKQTRKKLEAK